MTQLPPEGEILPNEFFKMRGNTPDNAEDDFLSAVTSQQYNLWRLSPITGLPVSLITEYSELAPSVKRVVDYMYEHDDCTLDVSGCLKIGGANTKQLNIDIEWLLEQGIVGLDIHKGNKVIFLTPKGEELVDEG